VIERELLFWPGVLLAGLGVAVLIAGARQPGRFWGFDLLGGVGVGGGALIAYESQRDELPVEIDPADLFSGVFDGWPQAVLVSVIIGAALLIATIIIGRSLPSWQRALAMSIGAVAVGVLSHLWSAGL